MPLLVKCILVHLFLQSGAMRITFNEGQISTSFLGKSDSIRAAAAELASHLKSLGPDEPHHVCVTGNEADAVVDNFILQGSSEFRHHMALTSKISSSTCNVEEAKMGNTLFTISKELPARCIESWKTHTRTCDVLLHAQSGPDCEPLVQFRMTNNNCGADMIVIFDDNDLRVCYNRKLLEANAKQDGGACAEEGVWLFAKAEDIAQGTSKAVKRALLKNANDIRKKFFKTQDDLSTPQEPTLDELRTKIQLTHGAEEYTSVEEELRKATQGNWLFGLAELDATSATRSKEGVR